ncbi:stage V sporulation protein B [Fonticella tunisiensis]|uniref:Stage V sporulation protein B n=1 Tax=Fonticella tunisiensis TaxID=1096341 RepID=A0A4V6Q2T2_9CLOT|nr:stage V sporulation protein B [Fonticella tunisiensis]TDT50928.1 stage V sporulation protein B [Fonticella tunisiensis]
MKSSSFFKNTVFLTLSNIITGTLSFIYSIILSREIGPSGMGLYQLVMPLYIMFLFITGGGTTVAVSKIAAEKKATGNFKELYRIVKVTVIFEFFWSLLITSIVVLCANYIASGFLSDERTFYSILAFCPALIIISISSIYKGTFFGLQRVVAPAMIDMIEKFIRVAAMFALVEYAKEYGVEFSSAAAVLALSIGELGSLILFYICYRTYVSKHPGFGRCDNDLQLIFNVLKLAIPLAINGIMSTVFGTITAVLIPKRLQASGIPYEKALGLFGRLQGMALSIVFYPTVVIGALNVILIPSISEAVTFRKDRIINHRMNVAVRVASLTAFSSTAILLSMPERIGEFFFKDSSVGELLRILAPGIPIAYIGMISGAILNGLGKQTKILLNSIITSIVDLMLIYIFIGIPSLNIKGYAVTFICTSLLGIVLNYRVIKSSFEYTIDLYNTMLLPLFCSILIYIITLNFLSRLSSIPTIILLSYGFFIVVYMLFFKMSGGGKKELTRFTLRS